MYDFNGNKLVRKFLPVKIYDVHGIELWLEEMSAQGLIFDSFGVRSALFREGDPEPGVRYRLEPAYFRAKQETPASRGKADWEFVDYEKNADYAQFGWEYVETVRQYYVIYRCRNQSAPELHTDPVTLGYLFGKMCTSRIRWITLLPLAILIRFGSEFLLFRDLPIYKPRMIWNALKRLGTSPLYSLSYLLFYVWLLWLYGIGICETYRLCKLRNQLLDGVPLDKGRRYPCSPLWSAAYYGSFVLLFLGLILSGFLPGAQ